MNNGKMNHKSAHYRVIRTVEDVESKPTTMYGIEGFCGDQTIALSSLSENRRRIKALVDVLNKSELELCHLCEVVDNFLYEHYVIKRIK